MADTSKSQDDLSIEEILGSIRRIIAEDEDDAQPQAASPAASAAPLQQREMAQNSDVDDMDEDELLELTNPIQPQDQNAAPVVETVAQDVSIGFDDSAPVQDTGNETETEDAGVIDFGMVDSTDDADLPHDNIVPEAVELKEAAQQAPQKEEKPAMTTQEDNGVKDTALLSSNAAIATAAVMAKLARQAAITEEGNGNVTLEAMVKEMIRPMLREWLDANLPELVQKMVERELERLTKRL